MKKLWPLEKKCDKLWSKCVKIKWKCEYCWKDSKICQLHSHHIFWRKNRSTRWELWNWLCLCASHHKLDSKFSAHETPHTFDKWLVKYKWQWYMDTLTKLANSVFKVTPEYLEEKVKIFKEILNED